MSTQQEDYLSFKRYGPVKIGAHMTKPPKVMYYCDDFDKEKEGPRKREPHEIDLSISVPNHFTSRNMRYPEEVADPYYLPELPIIPREEGRYVQESLSENLLNAAGIKVPSRRGTHDPDLELFLRKMRRPIEMSGDQLDNWMDSYQANKNSQATKGLSEDGDLSRFINDIRKPADSAAGDDLDRWLDNHQSAQIKKALSFQLPVVPLPAIDKRPSRIRFYETPDGRLRTLGSYGQF